MKHRGHEEIICVLGNIVGYYFKDCAQECPMNLRERAIWTEEQPVKNPTVRKMVHVFVKLLKGVYMS